MTNNHGMNHKLAAFLAVIYILAVNSCTNANGQSQSDRLAGYEISELKIVTHDGRQLHFTIYLATTSAQRKQGLSFVTNLPADYGMLFVFPKTKVISMWMKDTPNSLDMMFIDRRGRITQIVEHTIPNSSTTITSDSEAYAVLEVNAGAAQRLRIAVGDRLRHALLSGAK